MTKQPPNDEHSTTSTPSSTSAGDVVGQLARLIADINAAYPQLTDPFDPQWRSPCEVGEPHLMAAPATDTSAAVEGTPALVVPWRPCPRPTNSKATLFAPLERALEITVHPDIIDFYGTYYSGGLEADSPDGPVSLLQLWNDEDTERLIENLLGHALAKQRSKTAYSVFFALTEVHSEMFLSIENHTGHVLLERPGYAPERTVAGSLAEFLEQLTPAPPERHPERAAFLQQHGVH